MTRAIWKWTHSRRGKQFYNLLQCHWWKGVMGMLLIIFWVVGVNRLDPDFGWHYSMGKYVVEHGGVPKTDPFSYTMSSFHFVDHEWLSNVFMFYLYNNVGMIGMAAMYALMVIGVYTLLVSREQRIWALPVVAMTSAIFLLRGGVRPQVEMWLLFAVLLRLLKSHQWKRSRWIVVPLLWMWANLHGSFGLGLGTLFIVLLIRFWKEKRLDLGDVVVFVSSVLVTLVNPYGWKLWYEVWMQLSDRSLPSKIMEWQPFYYNLELALFFMALIWASFAYQNHEKLTSEGVVLGGITFLASLSSLRHGSLFAVVAVAYLPGVLERFFGGLKKDKVTQYRAKIFYLLLCLMTGIVWLWVMVVVVWGAVNRSMAEETFYPQKAVAYMRTHIPEGNYFAVYDWGGYLIWKFPEKKVFIDGRMPSWRWGLWPLTGTAPAGESAYAFEDYDQIIQKKNLSGLLDRYNIQMVLWRVEEKEEPWDRKAREFLIKLGVVKDKTDEEKKTFLQALEDLGWSKVYEDELAVIYLRHL